MATKRAKSQTKSESATFPVTPEAPFVMSGLRGDNPRDFLAALGVLRISTILWPQCGLCLSWTSDGHPTLHVDCPLPITWPHEIWQNLKNMAASPLSPFRHGKIEALSLETVRKLLHSPEEMQEFQSLFYPALCGQIHYEKGGKRSHLIIEVANRSVLNGTRDLLDDPRFAPDLGADLTGASGLTEVSNTPRWHPSEAQSAAYCAADPKDSKLMDRRSLNVLALVGLTFYPVVDGAKQRETLGTSRQWGEDRVFSWPIFEQRLDCDTLSSLLHDMTLHNKEPNAVELRKRGIRMAWRSRRYNLNQNDYFSPAEPLL